MTLFVQDINEEYIKNSQTWDYVVDWDDPFGSDFEYRGFSMRLVMDSEDIQKHMKYQTLIKYLDFL